jgi:hypothetical protein
LAVLEAWQQLLAVVVVAMGQVLAQVQQLLQVGLVVGAWEVGAQEWGHC